MEEGKGNIVFYQAEQGSARLEVILENESIWLTLSQIASLFDRDKSVISRHLSNVFRDGELDRNSTVAKNATVQNEGERKINREIEYFNLDVILSVGYRINSIRGTQFRIWANQVLKEYLVKGYAIDKKRLQEQSRQLIELKETVKLLGNVIDSKTLNTDEATGLLRIITDYAYALDILDQYDHQVLEIQSTTSQEIFQITYTVATSVIKGLKDKFGGGTLFGNEKDDSFQGSLAAIYQTFDGHDVYPSVEEKAGNLLYFVIKNH
jgi:prophage antirepressor-like protein